GPDDLRADRRTGPRPAQHHPRPIPRGPVRVASKTGVAMPEELNQPDRQLEAALAQLRHAPTQLDPAAIRLAAQQRLARRQLRRWQAIAAVLALALGAALVLRPRPREVERLVYVPMPTMPTPAYIEQPKPQPPAVVDYT